MVWASLGADGEMKYSPERRFYARTWVELFEQPLDKFPTWTSHINEALRKRFFEGEWFEMYDILEWVCVESDPEDATAQEHANDILQDYLCAYRFVGNQLVEMSSAQDIEAVEEALAHPLAGVRTHLSKALALLGDRTAPDLENCIKESISAVESLCAAIVGKKTTLGTALGTLEGKGISIHPAINAGWKSIYGWTSDADGIRHGMQASPGLSTSDAVYMLVSCSAFVALLTEKAVSAGIELQSVG